MSRRAAAFEFSPAFQRREKVVQRMSLSLGDGRIDFQASLRDAENFCFAFPALKRRAKLRLTLRVERTNGALNEQQ